MNLFVAIWLLSLAFKLAVGIWLPFFSDEAYYWVWGHHPQLSYFDHPPMIGWLFSLGTVFDGFGQASRIPGIVLSHFTALVWYQILRPYLSDRQFVFWLVLFLLAPMTGPSGIVLTPDLPLVFFWSLAMLCFIRCLQTGKPLWYLGLGTALGLGFCSKYHIVVFVPSALLWLLVSGDWRRVRWGFMALTCLTGLLFCAPVLIWNQQNDWASFRFQLQHGLVAKKWNWTWPLEYVGGQILLIFPPILYMALRRREPRDLRLLHAFVWFPLAFFFFTSFRAKVEANWPIMIYPSIVTLAFLNFRDYKWLKISCLVWAAALALVLLQVVRPWIPVNPRELKTHEFVKFEPFYEPVANLKPLYAGSYQVAGTLSYRLGRHVYKLRDMNRRDFYDFIPQSKPVDDKFYLALERDQHLPQWVLDRGFNLVNVNDLTSELRIFEVVLLAPSTDR